MMGFLINFCLITFICYAMAYPVRVILFGGKRKQRRVRRRRAVRQPAAVKPKRKAVIIPFRHERAA